MSRIGAIACSSTEGKFLVVSEPDADGMVEGFQLREPAAGENGAVITICCGSDSEKILVDLAARKRLSEKNLEYSGLTAPAEELSEVLRAAVLRSAKQYFDAVHLPEIETRFSPGNRIPYAGRVYNEHELTNLVDSSLDFWLTAGRYSAAFERAFAEKLKVAFCALVNSGSSANLLAMNALLSPKLGEKRLRPGDEVITVAAAFPTTVAPIVQTGCIPVFIDVDAESGTCNLRADQLEAALSPRTRALFAAHTLGNPFDIEAVLAFCRKHDLFLIEDNCDALGSTYKGQPTGSFGTLATSSFYPPHHITMGEGGAVYSRDIEFKRIVESLRDWGRDCCCPPGKDNLCGRRFSGSFGTLPQGYDHKYVYSHLGYNLKATDMQAAVGLAQLDKLDRFVLARKKNWNRLRELLADMEEWLILPCPTPGSDPSWFGFLLTVRTETGVDRARVVADLESHGIQTRMLFAGNLLRHPCMQELIEDQKRCRTPVDLSGTDRIMNGAFWVGVYPGMKTGMIEFMAERIRRSIRG